MTDYKTHFYAMNRKHGEMASECGALLDENPALNSFPYTTAASDVTCKSCMRSRAWAKAKQVSDERHKDWEDATYD